MSVNLQQLNKKANVLGDINLQQFMDSKKRGAEQLLSTLTDKAAKIGGNYKGEDILNFGKMFLPPGLKMLATGADTILDARKRGKDEKELSDLFKNLGMDTNPYRDYFKGNVDALKSQVKDKLHGSFKQELISNLMSAGQSLKGSDVGKKFMKKLGKGKGSILKDTIDKMNPLSDLDEMKISDLFTKTPSADALKTAQGKNIGKLLEEAAGDFGDEEWNTFGSTAPTGGGPVKSLLSLLQGNPENKPGFTSYGAGYPFNIGAKEKLAPIVQDTSASGFQNPFQGLNLDTGNIKMPNLGLSEPSLYDIQEYFAPKVASMMRGRQTRTVPGATRRESPSIRRRIV